MNEVNAPSQLFVPGLTAELPVGWLAKASITLLAPDGKANVIFSSEPLRPGLPTCQYAMIQGELLAREFPAYRVAHFGPALIFGDREGYVRHFTWTPPDGAPVTQIQLYHVNDAIGYTATATTPSENFGDRELAIRWILGGLRLVTAG